MKVSKIKSDTWSDMKMLSPWKKKKTMGVNVNYYSILSEWVRKLISVWTLKILQTFFVCMQGGEVSITK